MPSYIYTYINKYINTYMAYIQNFVESVVLMAMGGTVMLPLIILWMCKAHAEYSVSAH
jgi:hypothetical protein